MSFIPGSRGLPRAKASPYCGPEYAASSMSRSRLRSRRDLEETIPRWSIVLLRCGAVLDSRLSKRRVAKHKSARDAKSNVLAWRKQDTSPVTWQTTETARAFRECPQHRESALFAADSSFTRPPQAARCCSSSPSCPPKYRDYLRRIHRSTSHAARSTRSTRSAPPAPPNRSVTLATLAASAVSSPRYQASELAMWPWAWTVSSTAANGPSTAADWPRVYSVVWKPQGLSGSHRVYDW